MKKADDTLPADAGRIATVTEFTRRVKEVLKGGMPPGWVRGEVSNLRAQASGHVYFSLKDAGAQLACVLFRGDAQRQSVKLRDGLAVLAYGEVDVYEARGQYQFITRALIEHGAGRLQQELEQLKQRLAAEGLFAAENKQALPLLPRTVGFITSPTGAAVQDFNRILQRRGWTGRLVVLPAKVQGEGAAAELAAMLRLAESLGIFDLLVIGRGGGSIEDLWAFNEEPLVRAVAACGVPIISAVGHEIDFTLCDFAADVRAETPSAAAELISSSFLDGVERLRQAISGLDGTLDEFVRARRDQVEIARGRLAVVSPRARLERAQMQLDDVATRLAHAAEVALHDAQRKLAETGGRLGAVSPARRVAQLRDRLRSVAAQFGRESEHLVTAKRESTERLSARLAQLDPAAVLRRGYVIVRDANGRPVTARASLRAGQHVRGQFADGDAGMTVDGA